MVLKQTTKGKDATQKRNITENDQPEHRDGSAGGKAAEASRGDSVRQSARVRREDTETKKVNPQLILCIASIILAALSYVWPHTLAAGVILLGAVILMGIAKI
jgi:hypothetical protein